MACRALPLSWNEDTVGAEIGNKILGQRDDFGFDRDGSELWVPGREGTVLEPLVSEWWKHQRRGLCVYGSTLGLAGRLLVEFFFWLVNTHGCFGGDGYVLGMK